MHALKKKTAIDKISIMDTPTNQKHVQYDMHAETRVFSSERARTQLACVGMTDVAYMSFTPAAAAAVEPVKVMTMRYCCLRTRSLHHASIKAFICRLDSTWLMKFISHKKALGVDANTVRWL